MSDYSWIHMAKSSSPREIAIFLGNSYVTMIEVSDEGNLYVYTSKEEYSLGEWDIDLLETLKRMDK